MKKITIIFISVLMIFTSCSMDIPYDDIIENAETVEEPKEDDTKNNTEEPSNEEPKEDEPSNEEPSNEEPKEDEPSNEEPKEDEPSNEEPKEDEPSNEEPSNEEPKEDDTKNNTEEPSNEDGSENNEVVCEIDEDTKILGLNYFVCVDNSQTKLSPSINDERGAKKDAFSIRGYVSKYIEIRVRYNNKKLNFSSVKNSYIITDVMKKDSTINITIEWK